MNRYLTIFFSIAIALIITGFLGTENLVYDILLLVNSSLLIYLMLDKPKESYSLQKITNIFLLVFFVVALGIQYKNGKTVSSINEVFTTDDYIFFQILLFFIIVFYNGLVFIFRKQHSNIHNGITAKYASKEGLMIVISIVAFIITFASYNYDIRRLFFRGLADDRFENSLNVSALNLIIDRFIRPIPAICFMIAYITKAKKRCIWTTFLITVISLFPTSLARNSVAMIWLPIVLLVFNNFFRKKNSFVIIMLLAYFFVLPFLDNFRYYNGFVSFNFSFDYFNTMNFDAGQNFMCVIKENVITWGRQLLGVLLFFIPRSLWPSKPIGSGAYLASLHPGSFSNIAMPYFAEGYMNFGFFGVFIFTIFLAFFSARVDKKYWNFVYNSIDINYGMYLILVGAFSFILRGDFMSSFAYTVGICLSYFVISKVCVKKI